MSAAALYESLVAAGLNVNRYPGWAAAGYAWKEGAPVGLMHHHTAAPVPFPVSRLTGDRIKCNMNTKPDGAVWLVCYGATNYSSGPGSSVVLAEVKAGTPPTQNARERGLVDDTNLNPYYWNFENDHLGDGSPLPQAQYEAIITASRVVLDHFGLEVGNVLSHAESTYRKRDPYWNGSLRAVEQIREDLTMSSPKDWTAEDWKAFGAGLARAEVRAGGHGIVTLAPIGRSGLNLGQMLQRLYNDPTKLDDADLAAVAKAVNDELARRAAD